MPIADVWPPLAGLGDDALPVERALASLPDHEVESLLSSLAPGEGPRQASLLAARFSLAQRRGSSIDEAEQLALAAERSSSPRLASFVALERAAVISIDRARLAEARAICDAVSPDPDDHELAAARARVEGSLARASSDLRGSLLLLERARLLAARSGVVREIVRAENTLGTSYASLGVEGLARDALERARELAEVHGLAQSAAIAAGQLAVIALDQGRPALAARHLEAQRRAAIALSDVHGHARSASLLVEASLACHDPARARDMADEARALYSRSPSRWTRMQAVMATIFEAEGALLAGDHTRASELLASTAQERSSTDPSLRVVRARQAFVDLLAGPRDGEPLAPFVERSLAHLRASPRPTWVERALLLAASLAQSRADHALASSLALRQGALVELRASASARALETLRSFSPDHAVTRAMALGRDLVLVARLALAPLRPFDAHLVELRADSSDGSLDHALSRFSLSLSDADTIDGALLFRDGSSRALAAFPDEPRAARAASLAASCPGVTASLRRAPIEVRSDPTIGLVLRDLP